ncbi:MAG: hypothetical protein E6G44_03475 [Actinobacteria bacterium]|nr:MAG: hypothetical protein E6G44_03475 [Actinomycetota bacterium]
MAAPADPAGAYERIVEKKVRRRIVRRLEAAGLVAVVVAATIGGTLVLARAFGKARPVHHAIGSASQLTGNGQIAFVSAERGVERIQAVRPDGTRPALLTTGPGADGSPAWSPDGSKLAFSRTSGGGDIFTMDANGRALANVTRSPTVIEKDPAWSPDGRKIAFVSNREISFEVWVMNADGSGAGRLTNILGQGIRHPAWSPDGRMIAFSTSESAPQGAIWVIRANGSGLRRIFTDEHGVQDLLGPQAWSPDGKRILFTRNNQGGGSGERGIDVYTIEPDGTNLTRLTDDTESKTPSWSPDGKHIVFSRSDGLYVMTADGSDVVRVPSVQAGASDPTWQPASTSLPQPSPIPTTVPTPPACAGSFVHGDFDGDGSTDTAAICKEKDGTFTLEVQWGGGASGSVALPDCKDLCEARAAGDVNGDGMDEFFLVFSQGASSEFVEAYDLPASEAFGHQPVLTAPPGSPPRFPPDEPTRFEIGGSVTHQGFLTCGVTQDGVQDLISTTIRLSQDGTTWNVHEAVFTLEDPGLTARFAVDSTRDYTAPFDPEHPFIPPGDPCLDV